jgi:serine protease Do
MKKQILMLSIGFAGGILGTLFIHLAIPGFEREKIYVQGDALPARAQSVRLETPTADAVNEDFILASSVITQSVVYIKTISETRNGMSWYDMYFGGGTHDVLSSGSGVIFSRDGYIITNNHVIQNAKDIEVVWGKRPYPAKVIGIDPSTDLAVLKIEGDDFPAAMIGTARTLSVGEWVLAVGNPFNLTSTVTAGIVSAKGRNLNIVQNQFPIESFIQTDAAINPGNSGGALVNLKGELVGINTAIISKTGSYAGYGFAVPIDIVGKVVNDLIRYGKVQKAFTGATVSDLDFDMAKKLNSNSLNGVAVTHVNDGSSADEGGLVAGDVVVKLNGNEISSKANWDEELSYHNPGDKITLLVRRENTFVEIPVKLTNEEGETDILRNRLVASDALGASFEPISKVEKEQLGTDNGVRLTNIRRGMLSQIGIQDGFILISVNGKKMESAEDCILTLQNTRGRVTLEGINKNGGRGFYSYIY